jgi:hypothetical protein
MFVSKTGSKMLGFAGKMQCTNCNNLVLMQVRQEYLKQSWVFIPMGTTHFYAFLFCPTCETKKEVDQSKGVFQDKKDYERRLFKFLDDGKEYSKIWISKLDQNEKEEIFKRLNSANMHSIVKFIAS